MGKEAPVPSEQKDQRAPELVWMLGKREKSLALARITNPGLNSLLVSYWQHLHHCKMINIQKNGFHTKVMRTIRDTAVMFCTSQQIWELTSTRSNYRFCERQELT
jgi:hypothetical protein